MVFSIGFLIIDLTLYNIGLLGLPAPMGEALVD